MQVNNYEKNIYEEEIKEKKIDIKGTIEEFLEEEKPELSQEEAIKAYREGDIIEYPIKRKKGTNNDEEENEDDEHLKRVKKELLESLKRVDMIEKKIFEEKGKEHSKNVKSKVKSKTKLNETDKTKEQVIEEMRQKIKEDKKERSREE